MLPSVSLLDSFQWSQFTTMLVIYLVAITAEAMSGALAAGRRNMDIFGVAVIASVTALGGGTIRDMVLGHYPISWTQHPEYIFLVIGAGLLTTLVARHMHRLKRVFLLLDAMGLIAFSLIGCNVALELGYPPVVVVISGMLTGISGGILRDVLCVSCMPACRWRSACCSRSCTHCRWSTTSARWCALLLAWPCGCWPSASNGACPCSRTSSAGNDDQAWSCPNPLTGLAAVCPRPTRCSWRVAACQTCGLARPSGAFCRPVLGLGLAS